MKNRKSNLAHPLRPARRLAAPTPRRRPADWLGRLSPESTSKKRAEHADPLVAQLAKLEALLLVAQGPLTSRRLAKLAGLEDGTQARTLISQLQQRLRTRGSGLAIEQVAGGYRLLTRPAIGPWLHRLLGPKDDAALTPAAMETLAVVAYRPGIVRAEIEAIRGVQCGDLLRQLIERDLLRIVGRSSDLGRPLQYGTTKRFLELFGLADLSQLPTLSTIDQPNTAINQLPAAA